jgi:hypothetical protein
VQADEQSYVLNSNVEDVEMRETDSDDEEEVLEGLEGLFYRLVCWRVLLT